MNLLKIMAAWIEQKQRKASHWLSHHVETWTPFGKKVALVSFCLICSSMCLILITQTREPFKIQRSWIPGHIGKAEDSIRILEKIYLLKRKNK